MKTETDSTGNRALDIRLSDRTVLDEDIDITQETTEWSAPDSTGRQYPLRTTKKRTTTRRGQKNNVLTTVNGIHSAAQHQVSSKHTNIDRRQQTGIDSSTKTTVSTPAWLIWLILGIIAAALIIILIVLKHYHII